jgi:hypothetical protein
LHPVFTVVDNSVDRAVDSEVPAVGAPVGALEIGRNDLRIGRRDQSEIFERP